LYYLSDATERVKRADLEQVLLRQGAEGERAMTTIAQEYIQEGVQLGIEQGIEQGRIQNLQDNILDLIDIRLGGVNEELAEQVTALSDPTLLRQLLREAATAVSLVVFVERLGALTAAE
jgi:flagellar biosynthesis/type III secretory pathway protein FliH